jgi:hypothetical protein
MKAVNGGLHHQAQIVLASILRLTARLVKIPIESDAQWLPASRLAFTLVPAFHLGRRSRVSYRSIPEQRALRHVRQAVSTQHGRGSGPT